VASPVSRNVGVVEVQTPRSPQDYFEGTCSHGKMRVFAGVLGGVPCMARSAGRRQQHMSELGHVSSSAPSHGRWTASHKPSLYGAVYDHAPPAVLLLPQPHVCFLHAFHSQRLISGPYHTPSISYGCIPLLVLCDFAGWSTFSAHCAGKPGQPALPMHLREHT